MTYLTSLDVNKNLSLKSLTLKLCMLLALIAVEQCQTLCALRVDNMSVLADEVTFSITSLLKTSPRGKVGRTFTFQTYPSDDRVRIRQTIIAYCERTKERKGQEPPTFGKLHAST